MGRSESEIERWSKLHSSYKQKGKEKEFNRRLGSYKGSLVLGREFREPTEDYLKRKDLKKFWDWNP